MECAKRYSASNIKKKAKDKLGTTKKKHKPSGITATRSTTASVAAAAAAVAKVPPTHELTVDTTPQQMTAQKVGLTMLILSLPLAF